LVVHGGFSFPNVTAPRAPHRSALDQGIPNISPNKPTQPLTRTRQSLSPLRARQPPSREVARRTYKIEREAGQRTAPGNQAKCCPSRSPAPDTDSAQLAVGTYRPCIARDCWRLGRRRHFWSRIARSGRAAWASGGG